MRCSPLSASLLLLLALHSSVSHAQAAIEQVRLQLSLAQAVGCIVTMIPSLRQLTERASIRASSNTVVLPDCTPYSIKNSILYFIHTQRRLRVSVTTGHT